MKKASEKIEGFLGNHIAKILVTTVVVAASVMSIGYLKYLETSSETYAKFLEEVLKSGIKTES